MKVGNLKIEWHPCNEDGDTLSEDEAPMFDDPKECIGQKFCMRCDIKGCVDLPVKTDQSYCQYHFNGQIFTTECVEQATTSPTFDYSEVHIVESMDESFVDWMENRMLVVQVYCNPYVEPGMQSTWEKLSTENEVIRKNFHAEGMPKVESAEGTCLRFFSFFFLLFCPF